jgi:hypothetical protein
MSADPSIPVADLTVPELEQLARFDQHWRVVLEGDDPLVVWELRKGGYLDLLKRRVPLFRLSDQQQAPLRWGPSSAWLTQVEVGVNFD